MLREHVYNLVHNSLDSIRHSIHSGRITEGRIMIKMSRRKMEDALNQRLLLQEFMLKLKIMGGGS